MRLVIDLQALQAAADSQLADLLSLIKAVVARAQQDGHHVIAALNLQSSRHNDHIRTALGALLPADNLPGYSLPAAENSAWAQASQQALREYFFVQLQAEAIYLPLPDTLPAAAHTAAAAVTATTGSGHFTPLYSFGQLPAGAVPTLLHVLQGSGEQAGASQDAGWPGQLTASLVQARALPQLAVLDRPPLLYPAFLAALAEQASLHAQQGASGQRIVLFVADGVRPVLHEVLACLSRLNDMQTQIILIGQLDALARQYVQEVLARHAAHTAQLVYAAADNSTELICLLQQASCVICHHATLETAGLQAMACARAVLCEASLELAQLLPPEDCYAGPAALAPRLMALLQDSALCERSGTANAATAQEKTAPQLASQIVLQLRELAATQQPAQSPAAGTEQTQKPRLAYISPLPPQKSGIADYSVELLPELARYFEIDLILQQDSVDSAGLESGWTQRDVAWFEQHAQEFAHVLYHFGNSSAHQHMFALAERHPGVIVLHDFYLGNILDYLHHTSYLPHAFMRGLYLSHGFSALLDQQKIGVVDSIWKYPCNKTLLDEADGVIVHSAYPGELARQWYGAQAAQHWQVLPLLRGRPAQLKQLSAMQQARQAARAQFGWREDDFVLCSYGMLGRTKNNLQVLQAWLASSLAHDARCHLVFVGANDAGAYGAQLLAAIDAAKLGKRISITGFVSHDDYVQWLLAADAAVQLRCNSRGETSAAVLDCLLYGLPTVINAHGSSAELPAEVVLKLPDACSELQLQQAFEELRDDSALRARLRNAGLAYIEAEHAPIEVGQQYLRALQHFAAHGRQRNYRQLLRHLAQLGEQFDSSEKQWIELAAALAQNQTPDAPKQLFIDISAMVQTDLKTGIQRVVRSILLALLAAPPAGYRIEPVFTRGQGQPYHYARQYMQNLLGCQSLGLEDSPIHARAGDMFLGLDLFMGGTSQNRALLDAMRQRGVLVHFVVYDILPVLRPDVFPPDAEADFAKWLHSIGSVADGLVCISRAVADQLHGWLGSHLPQRTRPLQLGYFHLGADIDASAPSRGLPDNAAQILAATRARPTFLMVGTVEPRKGYAQALSAIELLWQQGVDINFVIVGKQGWMVEQIAARLQNHVEKGKRLFWLAGVSDEMLLNLYQNSSCLLAVSEGEGFGLPLIEAAQHGLPIIARKMPVFEEVMGQFGHYFDGLQASDLADSIKAWLALDKAGKAPQSKDMPWLTWQQSAAQLQQVLFEDDWYRQWQTPPAEDAA